MQVATNHAIRSEIGMAYHTPSIPQKRGKIKVSGTRNNICLVSDRNILFPASPILWKKLVVTICMPINGKNITTMQHAFF